MARVFTLERRSQCGWYLLVKVMSGVVGYPKIYCRSIFIMTIIAESGRGVANAPAHGSNPVHRTLIVLVFVVGVSGTVGAMVGLYVTLRYHSSYFKLAGYFLYSMSLP
jgi:hypothetical protein